MKQSVEFNQATYQQRTGIAISYDVVIAVSRSVDALVGLNKIRTERMHRIGEMALNTTEISAEHLLIGLSRDAKSGTYLRELGMDTAEITEAILNYKTPIGRDGSRIMYLSDPIQDGAFAQMKASADNALVRAAEEARQLKAGEVNTDHLLLASFFDPGKKFEQIVASMGVGVEKVKEHVFARMTGQSTPYEGYAEYVAKHTEGSIPTSIDVIAAYMRDKNADVSMRTQLVRGLDDIARRLPIDPRS